MTNLINWQALTDQIKQFGEQGPFDHVVIDNFFENSYASRLANEFPNFHDDIWHEYDNPIEVKKTCNNWNLFPPATYAAFSYLCSVEFTKYISKEINNEIELFGDYGLNGGGWHIHRKGGKLNTHLDYSIHPKLELQRKFNIIIYLNPNWNENWGGALGFWDNSSAERPGELKKSIAPKYNRAVIFDTTQNSWHGLPDQLNCPESEARKSLAIYYLQKPDYSATRRGKALFAPTEQQAGDKEILDLIKLRSDVGSASGTYKKNK